MTDYTETQAPDVVVYHAPCMDGFTAAWAIKRRWPDAPVRFLRGAYGKPFTTDSGRKVGVEEMRGKHVVLVDFSLPADQLLELGKISRSVSILDHHESARENLWAFTTANNQAFTLSMEAFANQQLQEGKPRVRALFDMEHSGAYLSWRWAFHQHYQEGYVETPLIVQYVEDRDMWWKAMPHNREIHANMTGYDWTFEAWDEIHDYLSVYDRRELFILQGVGAYRRYMKAVRESVHESIKWMTICGYVVPVCNTPYAFASDACEYMHELHPDAPFTASYFHDKDGSQKWSLRNNGTSGIKVNDLARRFKGGGHSAAAGFSTNFETPTTLVGRGG